MFANLLGANRQQQERDRTIAASVLESMEAQLIAVYSDKEILEREIGVSETQGVVALVKALEERVRRHEPDFDMRAEADNADEEENSVENTASGDGLKDLSQRIRILTGTVTSMEAQLIDVYADRELLYREAGIEQTQDVLVRMRENQTMREQIHVMEYQLAALYAQKHTLNEGLGVSDAREVVALVRGVSDALETAHRAVRELLPQKNLPRRVTNGKRVRIKIAPNAITNGSALSQQTSPVRIESQIHA